MGKVNENMRVDAVSSHMHGKRTQVTVVNNEPMEKFNQGIDSSGRSYIQLKLDDSDIFGLIQELQSMITSKPQEGRVLTTRFPQTSGLSVVKDFEEEE